MIALLLSTLLAWCPLVFDHSLEAQAQTTHYEMEECWFDPFGTELCMTHRLDCQNLCMNPTCSLVWHYCNLGFHTDPSGPVRDAGWVRGDVTYRVRACNLYGCSNWSNTETCEGGPWTAF